MGPASPPTRRTQRERREHTESALLTAAAELVVERGVLAVTLANVAERAGYSRGIVTHQFGTKGAMLRALAHASQAGFVPGLTDVPPGADRLLRIIDGYLGQLADIAVMNRAFLVLWAESATTPELTPIFRERDAAFRADLRADVEAAIAEGAVRADLDPTDVAVGVAGQLRGIALQYFLDPDAVDPDHLRESVSGYWRRALGITS